MKKWVFFCAFIFFGSGLLAQPDSRQQTLDRAATAYLNTVREESVLFYGAVQEAPPRATNHPYLEDAQYVPARLSYGGVVYPEAMLRLDLKQHELIVLSPDQRQVVLFPENVEEVELHGRRIVWHQPDGLPGCPTKGYYFLLHCGECRVLARQTADLTRKNSSDNYALNYYIFTTRYYLLKDGRWQVIRSRRGWLNALQPFKKEVKQWAAERRLSFRKSEEAYLTETIAAYEKFNGKP